MKSTTAISSIRALRNNIAALKSCPRTAHISIDHIVEVPDFAEYDTGTERTKAKYKFIKSALKQYLARATRNRHATVYFTPHWKYNNTWRAIVVGWPEWIPWKSISALKGHDTAYNILLDLLREGDLYVRIASQGEWLMHQAAGAAKGVTICAIPRNTAPRQDVSHHRSQCHIRPKLRPVRDIPKSAEFVESDIEDFEEDAVVGGADEIEDFSD